MATALGRLSDGASGTAVGVADRPDAGDLVTSPRVGRPGVGCGAVPPRVGATLGLGRGASGVGEVRGRCGAVGLTAGGASGSRGVVGAAGAARCSDMATKAATAQVTPAPAAVRTSLRRPAARRISWYRPGGGPR